jgi:hypothetical protein
VHSPVGETNFSIGVMSVATNVYLDYWKAMVQSANSVSNPEDAVTFFVFTDNPKEAESFAQKLKNVRVRTFEIEPYRWPEATLLRYQIFETNIRELDTDILMHLDADMFIASNPWPRIKASLLENEICLVKHPGFWRPKGIEKLFLYASNPLMLYRDMRLMIVKNGLGSWESNENSKAFVKRGLRTNYYCGGTWYGQNQSISKLLNGLAKQVNEDLEKGVIADWHDESHINKWSTENVHASENPELCYDGTYPQLKRLKPIIIAVRKPQTVR